MKMLNYLLELDISPDEIYEITHKLSTDVVDALSLSQAVVEETLEYYKSIGVTNISNIIINRPDLVLINKKEIESIISSMDVIKIVEIMNNDIEDLILFGI